MSSVSRKWPVRTATVLLFIVVVCLGMWAACRRVLEDPAAYRVLLRRVAVGCLAVTFVGGLPYALAAAGAISCGHRHAGCDGLPTRGQLHVRRPGYVALFGLLALRLADGQRRSAVDALGRRSLTG